jgi:tetratricopeptide (TPR) repeat protein
MAIDSKMHFGNERVFVDREDHIQTFKKAVNNILGKKFSVLVYYGVAGVGKTSLRKKFMKYIEEYNIKNQQQDVTWASILQQEVIWTSIDLQLDKHREKNTFLVTLKNDLQKKHKIDFPAFEIAHAIYWKKANPEISLRKENYLLFEGNNASDDILGIVNQIPYFGIVPNVARLLLTSLPDYLQKWWTKRGEVELKQLSEKEPLEIGEMLPYFWTQDLINYLEASSKTAVLFIDTYEALWEFHRDDGNSRDKWIREELIPRLTRNVLWVICGREALRWEEIDSEWGKYLTQYEVEKLLREYCIEYLESRGITDKEIQETIFKGSKGIPYYLELSADTYAKIVEKDEKPKPDDFGKSHQEVADRFFRFLSPEEKNSLNVLSIPHFWDYDLFKYLVKEFNTGYSTTNYEDLCSFSFIGKVENNKQQMHQLMQDCIRRTQIKKRPDAVKRIHKAIHVYYGNKIENVDFKAITQEHVDALTEAFYHAKESIEAEDLLHWFIVASDPFDRAAFWQLIAPLYEEVLQILEEKLGPEHLDVAATLHTIAGLYQNMGAYEKALKLYKRALDSYEKVPDLQHLDIATTLNGLAELYRKMGYYEKALPLYKKALDNYGSMLSPPYPDIAMTLNDLALLYSDMGNYDEALPLYKKALEVVEQTLGPQHEYVAIVLNNLALLYFSMECYGTKTGCYEKAIPLYQRALDIDEKVLGPQHPSIATTLNNLAGLYNSMGDSKKALQIYQRTLEIVEKGLGPQHPNVATTLNNLALVFIR